MIKAEGRIAKSRVYLLEAHSGVSEALSKHTPAMGKVGREFLEAHKKALRLELENFDREFYPWMVERTLNYD